MIDCERSIEPNVILFENKIENPLFSDEFPVTFITQITFFTSFNIC